MKTKPLPSQAKLKEDFTYNPETGEFTRYDGSWGFIEKTGYIRIVYEGDLYYIHRLIWMWVYGKEPDHIDHTNGDRQDNRLENLRNVDSATNQRNKAKQKNNSSGFTGVHWNEHVGKWKVQVKVDQKQIHLGYYNTPQEAAKVRQEFIVECFPELFTERHGT